ncbi:MAG: RNA-dependent DNA polymerase [Gammaproteobacteria bacterium]|nr:RNA-dependent DNA polymerase [Gammaproteobacteria bacterium]
MKRYGGLWEPLTDFSNLYRAAHQAARGKRRRPNVLRFMFHLERQLLALQQELLAGTYVPGAYHEFHIQEPKPRLISAAPFRDRVVHHILCNQIEPIFERSFIHDSYACRVGKGTHAALDRFTEFAQRYPFVLKCDVSRFFPSIDHVILKNLVARKIKDPRVLWLVALIIDHSNPQEPVSHIFPGDDLLTPLEHSIGLPIGNQTSQFFANLYLDPLDHFVKEKLGVPGYCRYCDDFVIFSRDKAFLAEARERCRRFLEGLRLQLHPRKSVIYRVDDGPRFLGFRMFSGHRRLARENVARMRRRLHQLQREFAQGRLEYEDVQQRIQSWIGHARHGDTWKLRKHLFAEVVFTRAL